MNEHIRAQTVRVINEEGQQVGIMAIEKALEIAREQEVDLVEISPTAHPPVCRLTDYGKHLYRQKKLEQKQKKGQKQTILKTVRLSMRTDVHDLEVKARKTKEFLGEGNMVKVILFFRGREMAHQDLGHKKIAEFQTMIGNAAKVEEAPKRQGHMLAMILAPQR